MNIIIPLGGKGERFRQDSYNTPKVLIPLFGKEMILRVIDSLHITSEDTLLLIYNDELEPWGIRDIAMKYGAKCHCLNEQTEGAAHTVLLGLQTLDADMLKRPTMLVDGDTIYHIDPVSRFRNCTTNAVFCFPDEGDRAIYSYIETNADTGMVKRIMEKERIGRLACTGGYCFRSGAELMENCKKIMATNTRTRGEFYTSCVISQMLDDGAAFATFEIQKSNFSCVGTPLELRNFCGDLKHFKGVKKRFCFDLDGTLVTAPVVADDYSTVKPIDRNISVLKFLKALGNHIIIHTARRMRTHSGNVGAVIKDVGRITFDTLEQFDIPYDELLFGKPYADFYIDDKAVTAQSDIERATGFYTMEISERKFNEIKEDKIDVIVKSSSSDKIQGEIYWYRNIPSPVRDLFPTLLRSTANSYTLEKIQGTTLSHLFVSGSLGTDMFERYLDALDSIHLSAPVPQSISSSSSAQTDQLPYYSNYAAKLTKRYNEYDYSRFDGSANIYNSILKYLQDYELNACAVPSVIHGDPVFSNCIVNSQGFHFIDMRGVLGDKITIFGDRLYDYSKVYQSIFGYDEILLDRRVTIEYRSRLLKIITNRIKKTFGEGGIDHVRMITASLLFSLIPLHDDVKCKSYYSLAQKLASHK